ncbi:MAG: hypothetical protein ACXAEU_00430 [Candidatus Hodarchaeales archaeon]|jgi:hypothetical protein
MGEDEIEKELEAIKSMASRGTIPTRTPDPYSWGNILVKRRKDESLFSLWIRQAWAFDMTPVELIQAEREFWLEEESHHSDMRGRDLGQFLARLDLLPVPGGFRNILTKRGLITEIEEL